MNDHWYTKEGKASHTRPTKTGGERPTTLRDARKEGLLPSVSGILNEAANPDLDRWKQATIISACYKAGDPLKVAATLSEYTDIIKTEAGKELEEAMAFGTLFHKAIETSSCPDGMEVFVNAATGKLDELKHSGLQITKQEVVVVNRLLGYAGTTDCLFRMDGMDGVMDFKTCKTTPGEPVLIKMSHKAQLAAYGLAEWNDAGEAIPFRAMNIYVSKTEPGRVDVINYEWNEIERAMDWFFACLVLWKTRRNYNPGMLGV